MAIVIEDAASRMMKTFTDFLPKICPPSVAKKLEINYIRKVEEEVIRLFEQDQGKNERILKSLLSSFVRQRSP